MNANDVFRELLGSIHEFGRVTPSRNGETKELTFVDFKVTDIQQRYIDLPGRNVSVPAQIAETMWVLAGLNDVDWLEAYLPQARKFSDDGKTWRGGYGPSLRDWDGHFDQLRHVIKLLKDDPTTRRAVISLYDPARDSREGKDIPCNNWLHFLIRDGKLHLHVATRSNDVMWGWSGINNFEWSVLLEIVAWYAGAELGDIHYSISSLHLYDRHYAKAQKILDVSPDDSFSPGKVTAFEPGVDKSLYELITQWFRIEADIRVGNFGTIVTMDEPLFRTWLYAISLFWGNPYATRYLGDDAMLMALAQSPKRKVLVHSADSRDNLINRLVALHTEKSAAYGDSWKKHGELFSIVPNVARKVDRILAGGETTDETQLDTAMDLVIYLCKYLAWTNDYHAELEYENRVIQSRMTKFYATRQRHVVESVFIRLMDKVKGSDYPGKQQSIFALLEQAVGYLVTLWHGPAGRQLRNDKRSWNPEA